MGEPRLEMATSAYPLPAYSFRVSIGPTEVSFADVSGLSLEFDHVTYRHGLSFLEGEQITTHKINKYVNLTFKKGTVHGTNVLYEWLEEREQRSVAISLCDRDGTPVVSWRVVRAVPVKLEAPAFDASSDDVAIETLQVMATGISVEHH